MTNELMYNKKRIMDTSDDDQQHTRETNIRLPSKYGLQNIRGVYPARLEVFLHVNAWHMPYCGDLEPSNYTIYCTYIVSCRGNMNTNTYSINHLYRIHDTRATQLRQHRDCDHAAAEPFN